MITIDDVHDPDHAAVRLINDAATAEGWAIFERPGSESYWQVQMFDDRDGPDPYPFDSDSDVHAHVLAQAQKDPAGVHARALAFLDAHNPAEAAAIRATAATPMEG